MNLSWGEMLVVGILALIVLGPKDLLTTFRAAGQWVGRVQKMAREFSRAMNDAADQAGVGEINKTIKSATTAATNPMKYGTDSLKSAAGLDGKELGPETSRLSEERKAQKEKMDKAMAEAAERRMAKERAAAEADPGQVDASFAASDTASARPDESPDTAHDAPAPAPSEESKPT